MNIDKGDRKDYIVTSNYSKDTNHNAPRISMRNKIRIRSRPHTFKNQ